ncbi:MAG TPA: hypothetical protein VMF06_02240 [Candidatus Limnocylindria bacterium]|nr:hypothetical protein [Candidatus Limnocylindria bacterium]
MAQNATAELSHERVLYDAALRKALTPEAYEKYVHFEKSRPASHEVEEIVKFAGPAGNDIGPFGQVLEDAIFETGATLTTPTHGPYDPDPNPTADPDKGMEILLGRIDRLRTSSNSLLTQISDSLPSEIVSRIRNYYEVQINELTSHISFIEKNAQFARMTDEEMTAKLRSDPAFLRSFISNP